MDMKKNEGINCSVNDCVYHEGANNCVAQKINVGPCNACSSSETVCETFKPNSK